MSDVDPAPGGWPQPPPSDPPVGGWAPPPGGWQPRPPNPAPASPWPPGAAERGGTERGGGGRRRLAGVAAAMLVIGLAAGSAVTAVLARGDSGVHGTAVISESNVPAPPGTGTTAEAEAVAHALGPAVGTVVARGASSSALGSSFVISHDSRVSYAITNNHVVAGARQLYLLMPDGTNLPATLVGTDTLDDLAVVSVPDTQLPTSVFGDSSKLRVGQAVIAIGSPLGNEGSVTQGVVSALHRTIQAGSDAAQQSETLQDVLQTDASINRGNSGGPLADTSGNVVGVNVAIAGDASNIGFSIPSNLAKTVAAALIARQPVHHPYLGIQYFTTIEAFEQGRGFDGAGVLVDKVSAGSPAERAGFHGGDVLQAVNGTAIVNGQTLGGLIQGLRVGDRVTFTVRRGGQTLTLEAALVDRPANV